MVKPATPLSVLLFVAFVLLLLSVISTPIVKSIPLASFQGVDYGVFGFCQGDKCSGIKIGYTTSDNSNFSLPANTRHSLSAILIVHPVAAFLTLVCFILAVLSHLHSPSHSARYLLILIILLLPTLLITLLAFLVDILLFVPHLGWGGWIVLASTILITASGVVTCAMRRTLVSRKARKKRIAENAEMNGDNFYARQTSVKADEPPPLSQQPTAPMVNGAPGADKLPAFATYESAKPRRASEEDDQIPLNDRSPSSRNGTLPSNSEDGMERYGPVGSRGGPMGMRGGARGARPYNGGLDEYGNPLPPSGAFGVVPPPARGDPRLRHQNSNETMNSQASRGSRGRGGYPQRGYGRGAQYGPPGRGGPYNGRGGGAFGPPRGGVGGPGGNGGRGGIPLGAMAAGAGAGVLAGEAMGRGQRGPPPGYGNGYPPNGPNDGVPYNGAYGAPSGPQNRRPSPGPPSAPGYGTRQRSPGAPPNPGYGFGGREPSPGAQGRQNFARNSPPPPMPLNDSQDDSTIGQAVEMDALNGSPAQTPGLPPPNNPLRESDSDIAGMVGLQQQRMASPPRHNESPISPSSVYSGPPDSYIPPRTAWGPNALPRLHTPPFATSTGPRSPLRNSPTTRSPVNRSPTGPQPGPMSHQRVNSGDMYYEDMDPRFADRSLEPQIPHQTVPQPAIPSLLVPGRAASNDPYNRRPIQQQPPRAHEPGHLNVVEPSSSYDSINNGDDSDSQFTSISQRGVNPEWRPPPQHSSNGYGGRIEGQRRPDFLAGNPDFEVPGNGQGGGAPRYIGTGGSPRVGKDMGYQPGNAM